MAGTQRSAWQVKCAQKIPVECDCLWTSAIALAGSRFKSGKWVRIASRSGTGSPLSLLHSLSFHHTVLFSALYSLVKSSCLHFFWAGPFSLLPPGTSRVFATANRSLFPSLWSLHLSGLLNYRGGLGREAAAQESLKWEMRAVRAKNQGSTEQKCSRWRKLGWRSLPCNVYVHVRDDGWQRGL